MRKIMYSIIIGLLAVISAFSKDLFTETTTRDGYLEINTPDATFYRVSDTEIDSISVWNMLPKNGFSLICFSENWCPPSYKEFNRLYDEGIINCLKNNNTRLIVLAKEYPFLNVGRLDSIAKNNIESDFEIYYYFNDCHINGFPCIWLIDSQQHIIYNSIGLKEDYGQLKDKLETYLNNRNNRRTRDRK